MPTPDVIAKLRELRTALAATPPDLATASAAREHLDKVLAEPSHAPHYAGLRDKLLALEADHSQVTSAVQALIQQLSAAGI